MVDFTKFDILMPNWFTGEWGVIDGVAGYMTNPECKFLIQLASECDSWTEIGTFHGRSAVAVALGLKYGGRLQLVDMYFGDGFFHTYQWIRKRRPDLNIITIESTSYYASKILPNSKVVFIDGDHRYDAVKQDILTWKEKCEILCGHDYIDEKDYISDEASHPGVRIAVDELLINVEHPADTIWLYRVS